MERLLCFLIARADLGQVEIQFEVWFVEQVQRACFRLHVPFRLLCMLVAERWHHRARHRYRWQKLHHTFFEIPGHGLRDMLCTAFLMRTEGQAWKITSSSQRVDFCEPPIKTFQNASVGQSLDNKIISGQGSHRQFYPGPAGNCLVQEDMWRRNTCPYLLTYH